MARFCMRILLGTEAAVVGGREGKGRVHEMYSAVLI